MNLFAYAYIKSTKYNLIFIKFYIFKFLQLDFLQGKSLIYIYIIYICIIQSKEKEEKKKRNLQVGSRNWGNGKKRRKRNMKGMEV